MKENELITTILDLYKEIDRLKNKYESNNDVCSLEQECRPATVEESLSNEALRLGRYQLLVENLNYWIKSETSWDYGNYPVVVDDKIVPFEDWYNSLDRNSINENSALFDDFLFKDFKEYLGPEIVKLYDIKIANYKDHLKVEEEDKELKGDK